MIRFINRARTSERGLVLIAALGLAILYLVLMELLLIDSSRELTEANQFRARVQAGILAENAAELAAVGMVGRAGHAAREVTDEGEMYGRYTRSGSGVFEIEAEAVTGGVVRQRAQVKVQGRVEGAKVTIDYTMHGQ